MLLTDFLTEIGQTEGNDRIYLKWQKGRTYNQEYSAQQGFPSDLMEKWKAFQTSKS